MLEVNKLNASGFTALDILTQSRRDVKDIEIGESLRRVGAQKANDIHRSLANNVSINSSLPNANVQHTVTRSSNPKRQKNWLEQKQSALMVVASLISTMVFQAGIESPDFSGEDEYPFNLFLIFNSTGFMASLSTILLLISGLPIKRSFFMWILMAVMWVAITSMALTYAISIRNLAPSVIIAFVIIIWIGILFLGHTIRLLVKFIKYLTSKIFSKRSSN